MGEIREKRERTEKRNTIEKGKGGEGRKKKGGGNVRGKEGGGIGKGEKGGGAT